MTEQNTIKVHNVNGELTVDAEGVAAVEAGKQIAKDTFARQKRNRFMVSFMYLEKISAKIEELYCDAEIADDGEWQEIFYEECKKMSKQILRIEKDIMKKAANIKKLLPPKS